MTEIARHPGENEVVHYIHLQHRDGHLDHLRVDADAATAHAQSHLRFGQYVRATVTDELGETLWPLA